MAICLSGFLQNIWVAKFLVGTMSGFCYFVMSLIHCVVVLFGQNGNMLESDGNKLCVVRS